MLFGCVLFIGIKLRHALEPNKYPYVSTQKVAVGDRVDITHTTRYALVKAHGMFKSLPVV